jgi:TolB-like protein/class 3 adenylate cyclase/Flp pilus assembly protein TadD
LTTILAADVVGYSRLMAADETGTLTSLKALRKEVFEPKTAEYRGRVVKLMGDGTLMEFGSVVDAVTFAVDVQRTMAERNTGVPEEQRIAYRMGINIGDIIVEGDDIYGDGVNVAARLEALAEPGGICVSRTVFNHVKGKVDTTFENLGEQEVKNIPEPVQVFKVLLDSRATKPATLATAKAGRSLRWPLVAGSLVVLVIVAGAILWLRPWEERLEPASIEAMAFPLPDKPSIAVLPFNNMSDDASQEYFADGMTEDVITDLSQISGLFVISRNSAFTYKGQAVKVRQVGEELGVRYVLEGSVRRVGEEVRINAQLIDATTGGHLWAERFDGTLADVFAFQDQVTKRIVEALALQLTPQEVRKFGDTGTDNVAAHDAYLLGLSYYHRRTPEDNATAKTHFEKAIELDPNYSAAYTALAKVYAQATIGGSAYSQKLGIVWYHGYVKAWRLLDQGAAQSNADYHVLRSWFALRKHQHDRAIAEAEQALELNPNDAEAMEALAEALIYAGRPEAGIELAEQAMRQSPASLGRALYLMATAEFALGNSPKAVEYLDRAMQQSPNVTYFVGLLAAVHGDLGQVEQAQAAFKAFTQKQELTTGGSNLRLGHMVSLYPFSDPDVLDRLANGFKAGGVPVGIGGYLPLHRTNRLSGAEIESLLYGKQIKGIYFWWERPTWRQQRTADGSVEHFGWPIHSYVKPGDTGSGRIEKDMLCEQWGDLPKDLEICVVIFRVPERNARIRWGDYVMVTETGPQGFKLAE